MPMTAQERIADDARKPRIVQLWFALAGLKSVVNFMQSGAHPDDETSAMLAALGFRDGLGLSYACAVRGEGGQNDIGTEVTFDLGVLRTAEMERAADVLDLNLYWLSEYPGDSIFDFGLSKSGIETMGRWDRDRVLKRFVEIVRSERPDILVPTFLDIPGQHGHHRAMTEAAHSVFQAAADPAFPVNLPVWEISKLYLPAWSGAGGSYDDEVPPPSATLVVDLQGQDPVTGWGWERIGQQSRCFHRSQGMGRWVPAGHAVDRPLHLAETRLTGADADLQDGLPEGLEDFADGADGAARPLRAASKAMRKTVEAFPDQQAILARATEALRHLRRAREGCTPDLLDRISHRLDRKEAQLARVIRLAAGVEVVGHVAQDWLRPGTVSEVTVEAQKGAARGVEVSMELPEDWQRQGTAIGPKDCAGPSDPYPPVHRPLTPNAPVLRLRVEAEDQASESLVPLLVPPVALPARSVTLEPERALLNLAGSARSVDVSVSEVYPVGAQIGFQLPDGWEAKADGARWRISMPQDVKAGLYFLPVTLDGQPADTVQRVQYDHIAPRARVSEAALHLRVLHADLPKAKIGYIGGGNDRVGHWLAALGANVEAIGDADLAEPARLARFDSIVIGIFAMRFREGLLAAMPAINDWVRAGGNLVTLYHRPWDNWDPESVPPKRLEIGQPSLRWRVTDETATVTQLRDHPVLNQPNRIGEQDWQDWHKERGLYFAKSWDADYQPLLSMADPDEAPHQGALLSADIGQGRHSHCALILHHQMEYLVEGAFRLMANLVTPRGAA